MDRQALQASRIIDISSRALANWAVTGMEAAVPDLPSRYGARWREYWLTELVARLRYLAQAVAVRRPGLFRDSVRWSRDAFSARGVEVGDLRASIACLRDALSSELPADAAKLATSFLQGALDTIDDGRAAEGQTDDLADHPLALKFLEPLLDGRQADAEASVISAVRDGLSVKDAYEQILQPAQRALGIMWHRGEITVADEHAGTAVTTRVMAQLRQHFPKVTPNGKRIAAMAAPGDLHDVSVRMIANFFEMDGWSTLFLGADVPIDDAIATIARRGVDLVAIGASSLLHVRAVGELIDVLRADPDAASTKIIVGGPPFNSERDLWKEVGADGYAPSARAALEVGRSLVFDS